MRVSLFCFLIVPFDLKALKSQISLESYRNSRSMETPHGNLYTKTGNLTACLAPQSSRMRGNLAHLTKCIYPKPPARNEERIYKHIIKLNHI